jgi:hypothetical protein
MPIWLQRKFKIFYEAETIYFIFLIRLFCYLQKESIGDGKCPAGFSVRWLQIIFVLIKNISFYKFVSIFLGSLNWKRLPYWLQGRIEFSKIT